MTVNVIPEPQSVRILSGNTVFSLTRLAEFYCDKKSEKAKESFFEFASNCFGLEFVGTGKEKLTFCAVSGLPKEGYRLTVSENSVRIEGGGEAGIFWGVQTLIQLLIQNDCSLCALEIEDFPRTEKRGLMLDCASWFFTPEAVKLVLDAMAFHKLNVFHWKLSGDMGWRLELFDNLLLSQIGSMRAYTGIGKMPHSGYYSQKDVKDILDYAEKRCIAVVPELDFPDHTAAAVCAYPSLSCFGEETAVPTRFGDASSCLCLGKKEASDFVLSVLDETAELFGSGYIHLGGGRSKKSQRSACPQCLEKMKELGTDESGLLKDFFSRAAAHLEERGVRVIVRSDEPGLIPTGAVFEKRSDGEDSAAPVIDAFCQLSLPYGEMSVEKCYEHALFPLSIGAEAVLDTEYAPTIKRAGELLFPRLGAFCENVWTKKESRSFADFLLKIDSYFSFLDLLGIYHSNKKDAFPGKARSGFEKLRRHFGK